MMPQAETVLGLGRRACSRETFLPQLEWWTDVTALAGQKLQQHKEVKD
jgi:hypothetical protein